jgi:RHS repeat-associated protein
MSYDNAGNLITDTYTGAGVREYDAENKMTRAWGGNNQWQEYAYNADGQRVRRKIAGQQTWQVYGMDGELLAEYPANGTATAPQKEYGYRNGQLLVTAEAALPGTQSVSWQNVVGASVAGNSLTKTAATGWGNAGASSAQSITAGDGYMELTVSDTATYRFCGLSNGNSNADYTDVDFAIHPVPGGTIYIYEGGISRGTFGSSSVGDVLRVAVEGGVVKYRKNGALLYTSTVTPIYPLLVDSALYATGDTLSNVVVTSSASGAAKVQWLVPDHLGTPRIIIDQTGSLANVKRHDYLPFGEELFAGTGGRTILQGYSGGDGVRQQFTQKERDIETGLDYFLARYYSSTQGRFTSPDEFTGGPVELFDFSADAADNPTFYADLSQPQSLNKYHYCLNNPLNYVDPNGHQQALTQRIMWEQGYFQRLAAPIGAAVDKAVDKVSHPFRTAGEVRERVQKALGTDRESLIKSNMEDGFSREQAEMLADKAIAFNDSVLMGPTQGLKFEQSAERGLVSQGYKVTRGDDIAEGMADILAVASDKRSGIVREVTTSASKSISQIRKQLQNGFDYMTSQGQSNVRLQVQVNSQRAAARLRNELGRVRNQIVEIIVSSK